MHQGQADDKFPGQILHFTGADPHVTGSQFFDDILDPAMPQEKSLADKDQHVVTENAAGGYQSAQGLGPMDGGVGAVRAVEKGLVRRETAQMKRSDRFGPSFVDLERGMAIEARGLRGPKGQRGPPGEEVSR
jgi:hypothetical protein